MNLNRIAQVIAAEEAGKKEISIAQIKEVMRIFLEILAGEDCVEVLKLLKRYN